MTSESSKIITRRKFFLSSLSLVSLALPITHFTLWESATLTTRLPQKPKRDNYKFFNQYQASVIEELTSLIIPSDGGPGAKEAGAVSEIDKMVAGNKNLQFLYNVGIQLLDSATKNLLSKDKFLQLDDKEKISLLKLISSQGTVNFSNGKILRNPNQTVALKLFFNNVKLKTFEIFYSSKSGWEFTGYNGPPQWAGNPHYNDCSL